MGDKIVLGKAEFDGFLLTLFQAPGQGVFCSVMRLAPRELLAEFGLQADASPSHVILTLTLLGHHPQVALSTPLTKAVPDVESPPEPAEQSPAEGG